MLTRMTDLSTVVLAGTLGAVFAPSPAAAQAPCVVCIDRNLESEGVPGEYHTAQDGQYADNERGGGTHPTVAWPGDCETKHPTPCGVFDRSVPVTLDAIAAAVSEGDALEAYRIVLRQPEESPVYFMAERTAIQVRGCDGHVAVHIPLGHLTTSAALAAAAP